MTVCPKYSSPSRDRLPTSQAPNWQWPVPPPTASFCVDRLANCPSYFGDQFTTAYSHSQADSLACETSSLLTVKVRRPDFATVGIGLGAQRLTVRVAAVPAPVVAAPVRAAAAPAPVVVDFARFVGLCLRWFAGGTGERAPSR